MQILIYRGVAEHAEPLRPRLWRGHLPFQRRLLANLPGVSGAAAPRSSIVRGGVYAAGGAFFVAGSLSTRAKKASLQICRPEIACDFRQICQRGGIGGGSSSPAKRAQARDKSELTCLNRYTQKEPSLFFTHAAAAPAPPSYTFLRELRWRRGRRRCIYTVKAAVFRLTLHKQLVPALIFHYNNIQSINPHKE